MADGDPPPLQTASRGAHATLASRVLVITSMAYLASGAITLLPSGGLFDVAALLAALVFLALWLPFPVWLYLDRQRVRADTDYDPSKAYYLGWLPGYLGVGAILLYLYRRGKAYNRLDDDPEPTPAAEETASGSGDTVDT